MKRRFLRYLIGGFILFIILFVLPSAIISFILFKPVHIKDGSFIHLKIDGELSERLKTKLFQIELKRGTLYMFDVLKGLKDAAKDPRIKGIVIEPVNIDSGWAKLEELSSAILDFRKSGKKVYSYGEIMGNMEYYLSTHCDRIFLPPEGFLFLTGLHSSYLYFKKTLDAIGIQADIEHIGEYKSAGEIYYREEMSPELESVLTSIMDQYYNDLIDKIARNRGIVRSKVIKMLEDPPFILERYLEENFIDGLKFWNEIEDEYLEKDEDGEPKIVSFSDYLRARKKGMKGLKKVALISATGIISPEDEDGRSYYQDILSDTDMRETLREARKDRRIEGIIVRIDSPGGSGTTSDAIWKEISLAAKEKPLVISMSDMAASGGYYISLPAHRIVANAGTLTGSIGVLGGKFVFANLAKKLGINVETLSKGAYSRIFSPLTPFNDEERVKLRSILQDFYDNFISKVAEGRKMTREEVVDRAKGRVWTGLQAKEEGLVDEIGGLDKALSLLKGIIGIREDEEVSIEVIVPEMTLSDMIRDIFRFSASRYVSIEGILPDGGGPESLILRFIVEKIDGNGIRDLTGEDGIFFLKPATLHSLMKDPIWAIVPFIYLHKR